MEKRYYAEEVIGILGISRKTLYIWEKKGKIPKPKREPMNNYRFWLEKDLKVLINITGRGK